MAPPTPFMAQIDPSITPAALRSYLAEFISTFLYTLVAAGSAMACRAVSPEANWDPSSLTAVAVASGFGLTAATYISFSVSGGHVNPAVTFARAVGGHIPIPTAVLYWLCQMLAAIFACLLLKIFTVNNVIPHGIDEVMTGFGASILEGTFTFMLVYTIYAAMDPRQHPGGQQGGGAVVGSVVIGLVASANVLASAPFSGGSMNPALSFGLAAISGSFRNQAVYWVGPLVGGMLAGLMYDNVVFPHQEDPDLIRTGQDGFRI